MTWPNEIARVNMLWQPNQNYWPGEQAINGFWVHHFHFTGNTFDWDSALTSLAQGTVDKLTSHWGVLGTMFGSVGQIVQVKAAQIGSDGKEVNSKTAVVPGGTLQGAATTALPPEVALCQTFYGYVPGTFVQHAGRQRSRTYWPYISATQADQQGRVSNAQQCADKFAAFWNDIQGMHVGQAVPPGNDNDYWQLVAVSSIDASWHQIERIGVDNHFDSQRRRQRQAPPVQAYDTINHS